MADLTQIELPNGTTYNIKDSTKMPLAGGTFTGIVTHNKSIHGSSGETIYGAEARRSQWYKLTLATNGLTPPASNQWYMCSFTLNMAGDYSNTPKGSVYVSYYIYWNGSAFSADKVFATAFGNNMDKVKVYYKLTDPFILYIDSSNAYSAMWIDKISYRDSGDGYRTRDTVLETTSSISTSGYSTIQTACFYTYDGSQLYTNKSLLPDGNNSLNLGSTTKKWANGYFTNINGVAVGDSPKFTDTNNAVTQTATTTDADYEVLFSATADNTTRTEGARKSSKLTFCPGTNLQLYMTNAGGDISFEINEDGYSNIHLWNSTDSAPKISLSTYYNGMITCGGMNVEDVSSKYTATKSSGNWSITAITAYRMGNLVQLQLTFKGNGNSVSNGSNAFVGTLSGNLPLLAAKTCSFISSSCIIIQVDSVGNIYVRVTGANCTLASNATNSATLSFFVANYT